jgi:sugar phosphate isomerase/epimerase
MNTSRREFIINSALAATALSVLPVYASGNAPKEVLTGLQLYSIRDEMKNDPLGSLQRIAGMGYKHVEHANYADRKFYGWTATEFKKVLNDLGLNMPSGHTVLHGDHWSAGQNDFTDQWKYTIEDAAAMGQDYVISPWLDEKI